MGVTGTFICREQRDYSSEKPSVGAHGQWRRGNGAVKSVLRCVSVRRLTALGLAWQWWDGGCFFTFELTGWPHCQPKTRIPSASLIATATLEYFVVWPESKTIKFIAYVCSRASDGCHQCTRDLNSVTFGPGFDPCYCFRGSLRGRVRN